MKTRRNGCIF